MRKQVDAEDTIQTPAGWLARGKNALTAPLLVCFFFVMNLFHIAPHSAAAAADEVAPTVRREPVANKGQAKLKKRQFKLPNILRGKASWYGGRFNGRKTASGEPFDPTKLTAAHKTLPLGTKAIVTNLENGNSVEVEINDRGPYVRERIIDVSYAAAKQLGITKTGTAPVQVEPVQEKQEGTG